MADKSGKRHLPTKGGSLRVFLISVSVAISLLALGIPDPLNGQSGESGGIWVEVGAGGGWNLLRGLEDGSAPNMAGYVSFGATANRWLRIGMEAMGWARSAETGGALGNFIFSAINVNAIGVFHPLRDLPLYAKAGVGLATVDLSVDPAVGFQVRTRHNGMGGTFGVGADFDIMRWLVITPSVSWGGQTFGRQAGLQRITNNGFFLATIGLRWH